MTLPRQCQDHETGSALVYVLWIAAAIALVLAAASVAVQGQLRLGATERNAARADTALRSALDIAAYDAALVGRSYLQGLPTTIQIDDVPVTVNLASAHSKLDINLANDERWLAFLIRQGVTEARARTLTDRILDWRDSDDRPREFGGEGELYRPGELGNRPFRSVRELSRVAGLELAEVACWAGDLTVYGGTPDPEIDASQIGAVISMDGVRAAFVARRLRPDGRGYDEMSGLALFGASPLRPFEWVAFSVDEAEPLECSASS
ncbi:general secretion pathway protein GspK [Maricaulaceae bacterium EIL42A08]|nr:general secretion pathway protein GspK [Maricaulaceae bacterium EIL42A08]